MDFKVPLRAVFYREEGRWFAHCLELDLIGDGDSKPDALQSLTTAISIQVEEVLESGNAGNLFTPADGEVFQRYMAGSNVAQGELGLDFHLRREGIEIEGIDMRIYADLDLIGA